MLAGPLPGLGEQLLLAHPGERYAIPEANASLHFGLSLGVTLPLMILLGVPLYTFVARHFRG